MPPAFTRPAGAPPVVLAVLSMAIAIAPRCVAAAPSRLRLATTTSTDSSGLLRHVLPAFEAECGCNVDVIAVGTGKALKLGERGDVDVVLVHARALEDRFVAEGWGTGREDVMYNDFVLVGPPGDPGRVRGAPDASEAFRRIAKSGSLFISRGDGSGTHEKELETWQRAGVSPRGTWYLEAGQGMSEVIGMAVERGAYVLTDRATYVARRGRAALAVLLEGDPALFNPYGVIPVSPRRHPGVDHALARRLVEFLTGAEGQRLIAGFRVSGERLFFTGTR
jgi:tungstate transport system substrate-binding protein